MSTSRDDPISIAGLGIFSFANKVLIDHPCTVLRRQAQVHENALKMYLTPISLVPIIYKNGFLTLWKGSIGSGVLWAMSHVTEIVIAHMFNLPKNQTLDQSGSREQFWRDVLIKTCTSVSMAYFYVSSFVEISGIDTNAFNSTRRLSMFHLMVPTAGLHIAHSLVSKFTHDIVYGIARGYVSRIMPRDKTRFHAIMTEMFASVTANLVADLVCFPLETVVHRLYIQGSLALIHNLDTGAKAFRVNFKYTGILDCVCSIIRREGISGFYQGVGAVLLQYSLQFCVLQAFGSVFDWIEQPKNQANKQIFGQPGKSEEIRTAKRDTQAPKFTSVFEECLSKDDEDKQLAAAIAMSLEEVAFVETTDGTMECLSVHSKMTAYELKKVIQHQIKEAVENQKLFYDGNEMKFHDWALSLYGIENAPGITPRVKLNVFHEKLIETLPLKHIHAAIGEKYLSKNWHVDLRNVTDNGKARIRGGHAYNRPLGCMRFGIRVLDKHKDNKWLGLKGVERVQTNTHGEWPVAYHGTNEQSVLSILEEGFRLDKGQRFAHGKGIYCTPDPRTALAYASKSVYQGEELRLIIQCRVDPSKMKVVALPSETGLGEFWLMPSGHDIRPYAVCAYEKLPISARPQASIQNNNYQQPKSVIRNNGAMTQSTSRSGNINPGTS